MNRRYQQKTSEPIRTHYNSYKTDTKHSADNISLLPIIPKIPTIPKVPTHCILTLLIEKKLSNKTSLALHLLSKCSFTPSKLRFFELRAPKISSCYTTSQEKSESV